MPQLDPSTYASQLFWLVICFFTMWFVMAKFIIPRIAEILELRQKKIDDNLRQAEEFQAKSEAALKRYEAALDKATLKANQAVDKAQQELKDLIDARTDEATAKLAKKVKESEAEINRNKEAALKDVRKIAQSLAGDIAAKIGIKEISANDIKEVMASNDK